MNKLEKVLQEAVEDMPRPPPLRLKPFSPPKPFLRMPLEDEYFVVRDDGVEVPIGNIALPINMSIENGKVVVRYNEGGGISRLQKIGNYSQFKESDCSTIHPMS